MCAGTPDMRRLHEGCSQEAKEEILFLGILGGETLRGRFGVRGGRVGTGSVTGCTPALPGIQIKNKPPK